MQRTYSVLNNFNTLVPPPQDITLIFLKFSLLFCPSLCKNLSKKLEKAKRRLITTSLLSSYQVTSYAFSCCSTSVSASSSSIVQPKSLRRLNSNRKLGDRRPFSTLHKCDCDTPICFANLDWLISARSLRILISIPSFL